MAVMRRIYLDSVKKDRVADANTISYFTLNTNGHIGSNLAVLSDLGSWVHNIVAHKTIALSQLIGC